MGRDGQIRFGDLWLDAKGQRLWRQGELVALTPKSFAVLCHLATNPDRLVGKEELLDAVWPDTHVTEAVLKVAVAELRKGLDDDPRNPRYIETVHRRGYRFIAELGAPAAVSATARGSNSLFVGRRRELEQLRAAWAKACQGERQIVFITGEAGIGKSTLIDALVRELEDSPTGPGIWLGRGQCIEQHGVAEPYGPLLQLLGDLARSDPQGRLVGTLRSRAPGWLAQLPGIGAAEERAELDRALAAGSRDRLQREICDALETVPAAAALLLVLEDLHWSDRSTLDAISMIAQRRGPARLLILATYRPVDAAILGHPVAELRRGLRAKRACEQLALGWLAPDDVERFITARLGGAPPGGLAEALAARTEGNPLFLVILLEHLLAAELLDRDGAGWELHVPIEQIGTTLPDDLRETIEHHIRGLSDESCRLLECASIAGRDFSVNQVAAMLETDAAAVATRCEALAAGGPLIAPSVRPRPAFDDSAAYRFVHSTYGSAFYRRIGSVRREACHARLAEWLAAHGGAASELGNHYRAARQYIQAADEWERAAERALASWANTEAENDYRCALEALAASGENNGRTGRELRLLLGLARAVGLRLGYSAPETVEILSRARSVGQSCSDPAELELALFGLTVAALVRSEISAAAVLADELFATTQAIASRSARARGEYMVGLSRYLRGEIALARDHLLRALENFDPQSQALSPIDSALMGGSFAALSDWHLGLPATASARSSRVLKLSDSSPNTHDRAMVQWMATHLQMRIGDPASTLVRALETERIAQAQSTPTYTGPTLVARGWALARQGRGEEGRTLAAEGLRIVRESDIRVGIPQHLGFYGEVLSACGAFAEARGAVEEALDVMGENSVDRPLLLAQLSELMASACEESGVVEATAREALDLARTRGTLSDELRVALTLARQLRRKDRAGEAYDLVAGIRARFCEGFDTPDLVEAASFLAPAS